MIALHSLLRGAATLLLVMTLFPVQAADTLQRIRASNSFTMGFVPGNAPFSDGDASTAEGYGIDLCRQIATHLQQQLALPQLQLHYQPLSIDNMLTAISDGKVDILCSPVVETLKRREQVSFSLPIFTAGLGVIVRKDAPPSLLDPLNGKAVDKGPTWRASLNQGLNRHSFAVQAGTVSVDWAQKRIRELGLQSILREVHSNEEGVALVASGKVDGYFADRLILLNYQAQNAEGKQLLVPERLFEVNPVALAVARGDDDMRLRVDSAISAVFRSAQGEQLYSRYFGTVSEQTRLLMRLYSRP